MHALMRLAVLVTLMAAVTTAVACGPVSTPPATRPADDSTATGPTAVPPTTELAATTAPDAAPTSTREPVATGPLDAAEERELMVVLAEGSPQEAFDAMERVRSAGDERYIPVFIELLRARQIGLVRDNLTFEDYLSAIAELNGGVLPADNWFDLIEWYGQTDIAPPPGFTSWKGRLLSQIDARFGVFFQDNSPSRIRVEEVQWGGVRLDGIPALDNPAMLTAGEADYLNPADVVFGLSLNGESKAYPLRILDWHEMANDVVGGVPVSLAYCTLCGAAVAYDGRASNGDTFTFGSSGFLFRSNKLMYDRQTRTLWNQLTGEPVLGPLAETNVTLEILPVVLTSWEAWRAQHPDTLVVDIDTGYARDYAPGAAYAAYFAFEDTMFPVWQRSDLLEQKAQVYAVRVNDVPKAYPIETLVDEQVVNDTVGDTAVVLVAPSDVLAVEGTDLRSGRSFTYAAGTAVRAYARDDHTFSPGPDPNTLTDESGATWQVTEDALIGPDGDELARLGGHLAYWFGWFAFFPNTAVYGIDSP